MKSIYERVLEIISSSNYQPMTVDSLFNMLNLDNLEYTKLVKTINELDNEGIIYIDGDKIKNSKDDEIFRGRIIKIKDYNSICLLDDGTKININNSYLNSAYINDIVHVQTKYYTNMVKDVIERQTNRIIVKYRKNNFIPLDDNFYFNIECDTKNLKDNSYYVLKIEKYYKYKVKCSLLEVCEDKDILVYKEIVKSQLKYLFDENIVNEANNISKKKFDLENRIDLTNELIVTIDGIDAKDLDDAISLKILDNGNFYLGVHIADVSYYVEENSLLDKEAYARSFSIYLPDRVIPMLPTSLSNGVCSLNKDSRKLTISCMMEIDYEGNVVNYDIKPSFIESKGRLDYDMVDNLFEHKACNYSNEIKEMLFNMLTLSKILSKKMKNRGYLELNIKDSSVVLDENSKPVDIKIENQTAAKKLIENFMIIANETVASHIYYMNLPFVYRIHDKPSMEKVEILVDALKELNINPHFSKNSSLVSNQLQAILNDNKNDFYVNNLILRTMAKACYSTNNAGHFGLGSDCYTHFTSPIRRYPDLLVHRYLRKYCFNNEYNVDEAYLENACKNASTLERKILELERMTLDIKKAEYMNNFIGSVFEGTVTGYLNFGMFVRLDNTCEGLLDVYTLPRFYNYLDDYDGASLKSDYPIGSKIMVKVSSCNVEKKEINFAYYKKKKYNESGDKNVKTHSK